MNNPERILVCYTFPIDDYYGTDVFHQYFYVTCNQMSPTKDELITVLEKKQLEVDKIWEEHPEYGSNPKTWDQCITALKLISIKDNLPRVYKGGLIRSNIFIEHPKFGKQSIDVGLIMPVEM